MVHPAFGPPTCAARLIDKSIVDKSQRVAYLVFSMIVDGSKIGFTRAWRGLPVRTQKIHNERAGAKVHYDAKEDGVDGTDLAKMGPQPPSKSKRDTIFVYLLRLVVDRASPEKGLPGAQFEVFLDTVRECQPLIVETGTGRRSDNKKDWLAMIDWARKSIARGSCNLPEGFAKNGRPVKDFTEEEKALAKRIWQNLAIATDPAAAAMFPGKMTKEDAKNLWGPSGRKPGRKPQQKRKR